MEHLTGKLEISKNFKRINEDLIQQQIESAKKEFLKNMKQILETNEMLKDAYFQIVKLEFVETNGVKLLDEITEILLDLADHLTERVYIVSTPHGISGYTSVNPDIYLKVDYLLYEFKNFGKNFDQCLQACFVLAFIHEIIYYLRRKLAQRGHTIVDTPELPLSALSIVQSLNTFQQQNFLQRDAGKRVEILLFGEQLSKIYHSEIETFLNFQDYKKYTLESFRTKFIEKREEIKKKNPPERTLHVRDEEEGVLEIGNCASAGIRNLIF